MLQLLTLQLALTEVTIGSLLHSFRIPLKGHLLGANQALILNWILKEAGSPKTCTQASAVAAVAKLYSIGGKRFRPMVAIFVQGLLFSLGTQGLGSGIFGRWLGSFLLCLWPSIQGLVGGTSLFLASGDHFWAWIPVALLGLSTLLSTAVVILSSYMMPSHWMKTTERFQSRLVIRKKKPAKTRVGRALQGTFSWPLLIIVGFHSLLKFWRGCWDPYPVVALFLMQFFLLLATELLPWEKLGHHIVERYTDEGALSVKEVLSHIQRARI